VVVHHLYAAGFADGAEYPQWVAYRVLNDTVGVASLLPREWREDRLRPVSTAVAEGVNETGFVELDIRNLPDREYRIGEYRRRETEQGRLVPMSSFAGTPYWEELNQLSNRAAIPQSLRAGAWARLNQAINQLAQSREPVLVISGPWGDGHSLFKAVRVENQFSAYLFPASLPEEASFCQFRVSLQQLLAGLAFSLTADDLSLVDAPLLPRCELRDAG
jgi:endonuclease G